MDIKKLRGKLRKKWRKSKERLSALKAAEVAYGRYRCAKCKRVFYKDSIEVDHRVPAGRLVNIDTYIKRLFCPADELDVLCKYCHQIKSYSDELEIKLIEQDEFKYSKM